MEVVAFRILGLIDAMKKAPYVAPRGKIEDNLLLCS